MHRAARLRHAPAKRAPNALMSEADAERLMNPEGQGARMLAWRSKCDAQRIWLRAILMRLGSEVGVPSTRPPPLGSPPTRNGCGHNRTLAPHSSLSQRTSEYLGQPFGAVGNINSPLRPTAVGQAGASFRKKVLTLAWRWRILMQILIVKKLDVTRDEAGPTRD